MMPKVVLTFRLAHRFMTAKAAATFQRLWNMNKLSKRVINTAERRTLHQLFKICVTIATKHHVIQLQKQNLYQSLLHLETVLFSTN